MKFPELLEVLRSILSVKAIHDADGVILKEKIAKIRDDYVQSSPLDDKKALNTFQTTAALALREEVDDVCTNVFSSHTKDKAQLPEVAAVISAIPTSIWMVKDNLVAAGLPFELLDDVWEHCTVEECSIIMDRVECLTEGLREHCMPDGRKPLLKACVRVLRRVSRASHSQLCGRILLFLASVIPMTDRSGLNLKSDINLANTTEVEEEQDGEIEDLLENDETMEDYTPLDYQFYKTFWRLQQLFQLSPASMYVKESFQQFADAAQCVLDTLEKLQPNDPYDESSDAALALSPYSFPKYLTAARLLSLQLRDNLFRQHILLQVLIVLHSIPRMSGTTKGADEPVLSDHQKSTIRNLWKKALAELEKTKPHGKQLNDIIVSVLQREDFFIAWKRDSCKPFEKAPIEVTAKRPESRLPPVGSTSQLSLGNKELSRLWNLDDADTHNVMSQQEYSNKFLDKVRQQMDPEAMIEEEFKEKNSKLFLWRAIRMLSRTNLHDLYNKGKERTMDLERVVQALDDAGGQSNVKQDGAKEAEKGDNSEEQDAESEHESEAEDEGEQEVEDSAEGEKVKARDEAEGNKDEGNEEDYSSMKEAEKKGPEMTNEREENGINEDADDLTASRRKRKSDTSTEKPLKRSKRRQS